MEGRVKSHISNKTYITNLEVLEEEDVDAMSELYIIPISGHKILVAPGISIMDDGIAYCYAYVIHGEMVVCKLGVYEKKTDSMPAFFDLSTFPEGSFCLFEEYETNPTRLMELKMQENEIEEPEITETKKTEKAKAKAKKTQNIFDFLIEEFAKIPNKRERLKSAYKSLFVTYESKKSIEKYKKMKPILKIISEAGKEAEPTDAFIQTLKTNAQDKLVFVMTILALERVFFIEFTFVTEYEMTDEREEYIKMKEDWPISNATKDLEIDVNTYSILDPNYIPKNAKDEMVEPDTFAVEGEAEPESESESVPEKEIEVQAAEEEEAEEEPEEIVKPMVKSKAKPATIYESVPLSAETITLKKMPKTESSKTKTVPRQASDSVKEAEAVAFSEKSTKTKKSVQRQESDSVKELVSKKTSLSKATSDLTSAVSKVKESETGKLKQSRSIPKVKPKENSK